MTVLYGIIILLNGFDNGNYISSSDWKWWSLVSLGSLGAVASQNHIENNIQKKEKS